MPSPLALSGCFASGCGTHSSKKMDVLVARNTLLDLLNLAAPYEGKVPKEDLDTPTVILDDLLDLAAAKGLFDGDVPQYRINFETRLMGALMPRESEVCKKFRKVMAKHGPKAATDWFYHLCVVSNYIRTAQIAQNIQWKAETPYGEMEITINLTKPEKTPRSSQWSGCSPRQLPQMHALQREHRLRRPHQLPGPPNPPASCR